MEHPVSEWHLTTDQARNMAEKIKNVEVLNTLAQQEINLTGGEASQNPDIVEICKIFQNNHSTCLPTYKSRYPFGKIKTLVTTG